MISCEYIYSKFCTKNPNVVSDIVNYKRWGDSSIVVECKNDIFYKTTISVHN